MGKDKLVVLAEKMRKRRGGFVWLYPKRQWSVA